MRDGTGIIQCVAVKSALPEDVFEALKNLTQESSLIIRGKVREEQRAPGGYELDVETAEPDAVRDPDALPCETRVEAVDGAVVKDRRLQAHATQGAGVRPDPFDEGVMLAYPVCGEREAFGQSPAPFADDVIAPLEDVERQSLVHRGA